MYTLRHSGGEDAHLICELWDGLIAAARGNQSTPLVRNATQRAGREA